jgi:CRISPR-associated exonuclease Cas4
MNYDNEDINIGKLIHEKSYSRETKNINLGEVAFDFVKKGKEAAIFEIKKSSKLEKPAKYQLYYYLWYVKQTGKEIKGVIVYPKEKKKEELKLTPEIEIEIEDIVKNIKKLFLCLYLLMSKGDHIVKSALIMNYAWFRCLNERSALYHISWNFI